MLRSCSRAAFFLTNFQAECCFFYQKWILAGMGRNIPFSGSFFLRVWWPLRSDFSRPIGAAALTWPWPHACPSSAVTVSCFSTPRNSSPQPFAVADLAWDFSSSWPVECCHPCSCFWWKMNFFYQQISHFQTKISFSKFKTKIFQIYFGVNFFNLVQTHILHLIRTFFNAVVNPQFFTQLKKIYLSNFVNFRKRVWPFRDGRWWLSGQFPCSGHWLWWRCRRRPSPTGSATKRWIEADHFSLLNCYGSSTWFGLNPCVITVLSRGVRSLFGPTRKSSPWGSFFRRWILRSRSSRLIDWLTIS